MAGSFVPPKKIQAETNIDTLLLISGNVGTFHKYLGHDQSF